MPPRTRAAAPAQDETSKPASDPTRGTYTAIFDRFWDAPNVATLGPVERLAFIALKAALPMSGIATFDELELVAALRKRMGVARADALTVIPAALDRLEESGLIRRAGDTIWIVNGLRWEANVSPTGGMNPNTQKSVLRQVQSLRQECQLVRAFWATYGEWVGYVAPAGRPAIGIVPPTASAPQDETEAPAAPAKAAAKPAAKTKRPAPAPAAPEAPAKPEARRTHLTGVLEALEAITDGPWTTDKRLIGMAAANLTAPIKKHGEERVIGALRVAQERGKLQFGLPLFVQNIGTYLPAEKAAPLAEYEQVPDWMASTEFVFAPSTAATREG